MTKTTDMGKKLSTGFTLIELIVVIAIISVLSSIALTSLDIARNKAKDSTIRTSVNQMRTLMEQEFLINKNYTALQSSSWRSTAADCNSGFSGTYATNATNICKKLIADTRLVGGFPGSLWIGPGRSGSSNTYTIMVYLPGSAKYYCAGSDEQKSLLEDGTAPLWASPGCWYNY